MNKKEVVKKTGLNVEHPDSFGMGPDGNPAIMDRNHYQLLENPSVGKIYYTPKDNKYWTGVGAECSAETLKAKYLRYLRWNFDNLVKEVVETTDAATGKKSKKETGYMISLNPCSPENIAKKRKELIDEAMADGREPNYENILNITRPTELKNSEAFDALLDQATPLELLARRLNQYSR